MHLSVRDLSFSFGESRVLDKINFEVKDGEFVGLMGPNGSGKTTLLRCMMRFLAPEKGSIEVDGKSLIEYTPTELARTFAVVPQSSSSDFTFTAYDIVMMGRMPHVDSRFAGTSRRDAAIVEKAMRRTNTWQFASKPFSSLSGGERQRVIVARAVAQRSRALLLDEPTVYLDISGQIEVMDLIKQLNREDGTTVIAVMHDVNLAARYCDRIGLLSNGALEAVGSPAEVLTPENIQSVYGMGVVVRKDPFSGSVFVLPHTLAPPRKRGIRVHLICGGGSGGPIMKALLDQGFSLSTGVVNALDSDFENAEHLHVPAVAEAPFSAIGDQAHEENLRMIRDSAAVVLSDFPVGPGNLRNLDAADEALRAGKSVFIVKPQPGRSIDFVGGRADSYINALFGRGAISVKDKEELVRLLSRRESG